MAQGLNRVTLIGNLGADPELKTTTNGNTVCTMRVATTEKYKEKEMTEWHRVVVWGAQAESCGKFLQKGRSVCVEGRIRSRTFEKDGAKHFIVEVAADRVIFLQGGPKPDEQRHAKPK